MPVALRSAVKAENKREWYKNVYDSLHRHPQDEIYTDKCKQVEEYFSEPELRTLGVDQEDDDTGIICSGSALPDLEENNHRPRRIDNFTQSKSSASTHVSCEQKSAFRQLLLKSNSFTNAVLSECRSDPCFKYNRRSPSVITDPSPELQKGVYSQIQRGGDIPACGLRKTAHDKPKEPREYENSLSGTTSAESLSREQPEKLKNSILASKLAGITLLYERQGDIQEHRSYPQSDREMRLGMNGQCKRSQSACQNRAVNTMEKSAFEKQIKPTKKRQRSRTFSSWETTLPASTLGASGTIQITAANSTITKELSMSRSENNLCHTYEVSLDPTVIERNASSVSELNTRQGTTENKIIDKPCSQHSAPVSPIKQSRASVRRNIRSVMSEDEKRMREKCWNNPKLRQKINPITKSRISTQVKSPISQQNHETHPRMTASRSTSDIANSKAKQQAVKTRNLTRPSSTASLLQKRPNSRLCSTAVKTTTDGVSKVVQPTKIILITQKNSNTSSIRVGPSLDIIASCKKAEKLNKKETLTPHVVPSKVKTKNKTVNSLKTELNRSHSYTNMDSARSSADSNSRHNVSHATSASEETGYISSESHLEQRHTDNEISKKQFGLLQDHMTDDQSPMCRNLRSDQGVKNSINRSWQYHSSVKDYGDSFCNDDHQKYDTLLSIPLSIKSTMSEDTKSSTDQLTSITAELNTLREWHSSAEKGDFKHEVFLDKIQQLLRISRRSQHFQKLKPHYIRLQQLTQSGLSSDEKDFKEVMDKVRILLEMLRVYESFDAVIQTRGKLVSNWRGDIALQCRRHSVEDLRRVFSGEMEHTSKLNCKIRTVADRISPRTCYSVDVTDLNDLGEKNEFLLPVRDLVSTRSTSLAIRSTKLLRSRQERIDRPFYFSDYQNTEPSAACVPNQVQKPPRMYDAKHGIQNRFHSLPHNRRQRYSSYRYDIIDGNYPVSECSPSFINSFSKIDLNVSQKRPLPTPRQTNSFLVEKHDDNTVITSSPFYRSRMVENGTQYHKTLKRIVISSLNSIRRKVKYKAKGSNGKPLAGVETVIKNIHQDNAVRDSAYRSTPHAHNAKSRIGTIGQVSKLYDRCAKLPTLGSLSISSPDLGTTREMTPYTTPWSHAGKNPLLLVAPPRPIPPQTLEFGPLNTTTARNISAQPQSQYTGPLSSSSPRSNSTEGVGHDFGKTANKQYSTAHLDWAIHRPIGRYVPDSGGGRCGVVTAPRPPLRRHLLLQRDGQTTCSPGYIISQPGELGHQATPSTTTTASSHLSSVDDAEYNQRNVHIHYPSPVRWRQLAHIPQHQLQHQQQLNMKTFYQLESQRKQLVSAEDRNRRRHGDFFLPHQKSPVSLDRYDHINVTDVNSQADNVQPALATVLYDFQPLSGRELGVKKGDIVRVRRQVNSEWFEVQRGSRIGIVPRCYIAVEEARGNKQKTYFSRRQLCARYNFKAENKHELSLNKGDIVDVIRRVDENWLQGKCGHNTGIFPANYVETISVDTTDSTSLLDTKHEQSAPRSSHNWTGRVNSPVTQTQTNSDKSTSSYGRYLQQLPAPSYHSHSTLEQSTVAYRALFPYLRQNDDELELREGDILHVLEQCPDGWFVGTNQRTSLLGTFPGNYVQRV